MIQILNPQLKRISKHQEMPFAMAVKAQTLMPYHVVMVLRLQLVILVLIMILTSSVMLVLLLAMVLLVRAHQIVLQLLTTLMMAWAVHHLAQAKCQTTLEENMTKTGMIRSWTWQP